MRNKDNKDMHLRSLHQGVKQAKALCGSRRWSTSTGYTTPRRPTGRATTWARSTAAPSSTRTTSRSASRRCVHHLCMSAIPLGYSRDLRQLCRWFHGVLPSSFPAIACCHSHPGPLPLRACTSAGIPPVDIPSRRIRSTLEQIAIIVLYLSCSRSRDSR